ncbi:MAG: enoyl-CoA hydratase/isomerase family protein [Solirubrobacterales bacterium]
MAGASYEKINYEVDDGVATITLDDPETRNALSAELLGELIAALESARDDDAVRVVVLTSSHEKVFSSGANLAGFGDDAATVHKHFASEAFVRVFKLLGELGKPSLVAANGHVLAGSLGIALACDLIIAKESAGFGTPEINVGLFPFMIMALIYRNVPRKKTNEMLLLGERLSAEEACEAGIVNKVVPAEEFDDAVRDWAGRLASKSPLIMRLGKDAIWRQMDMPLADALDYLRSQLTIELSTEDAIEGVTAFFAKREPEWKGR